VERQLMKYKGQGLALFGTGSLQPYLFRDNKMKHNRHASVLVADALAAAAAQHKEGTIYTGGGHSTVLFPDRETAERAIREWSLKHLREMPGMPLVAACTVVEGSLKPAYEEACRKFARAGNRAPLTPFRPAMPVVRECTITGQAATHAVRIDGVRSYVSHEASVKRKARERNREDYGVVDGKRWAWAEDLNSLGTPVGASQLLLAHPDLNGAGKVFAEENLPDEDEAFLEALRERSNALTIALRDTMRSLVQEIASRAEQWNDQRRLKLKENRSGVRQFPFLPLVAEADEATFIVPARIGFGAVEFFLRTIEQKANANLRAAGWNEPINACAGVLVMPRSFPFSRAYDLVTALCSNAKRKRRDDQSEESYLDFHVIMEGATGDIEHARRESYTVAKLCKERPYALSRYRELCEQWRAFRRWPRSRAKNLLQEIAKGADHAQVCQSLHRTQGYEMPGSDPMKMFDALELLDFLYPWDAKGGEADVLPAR
jgi:hypothetical protein